MISSDRIPEEEINEELLENIRACCRALDDKKADNLVVLDLRGRSSITDYFIIASGKSPPHLKALQRSLQETLKRRQVEVLGAETDTSSGWVVVDAFDFMVHIFSPEMRQYYGLETLWKDSPQVTVEEIAGVGMG